MASRPKLKTPFDAPAEPPRDETPSPTPDTHRRFRFGTKAFFGLTFLVAFAAAGYGGVVRGGAKHEYYVIFALMTPFFALGLAILFHRLSRWR